MKKTYYNIFLFISILFISNYGYSQCATDVPTAERDALIALYNATDGANWTNNTNWNTTACVSDWYGVTVTNGTVWVLDLKNNNLSGSIPTEIGNLPNLVSLDLGTNNLIGSIPSQIGNLSNLSLLRLNNNQLTNSIPSEIGNLSSLSSLYLPFNNLSGPIPSTIGNLTNLTSLALMQNDLTGSIPFSIGNLTNLSSITLYSNQLTGSIPVELGNLSNLTSLLLGSNQLSGSIPSQLGSLSSLTTLNFNGNQLTGTIPSELGNLSSLLNLSLGSNKLTGSIPPELGSLPLLHTLSLFNNLLTGSIPPELGNLSSLLNLSLGSNKLTGSIPSEFGSLSLLQNLTLSDNQLEGSIPLEFGNLSSLQYLYIYDNKLTGNIPSSISLITSLNIFRFQNNNFIFRDFESEHPTYISNLTNYGYTPQAKVDQVETPTVTEGNSYTFTTSLSSPNNSYQWYKDGTAIVGATSKDYTINPVALTDAGVYHVVATNSIVTGLTLERNTITLGVTADTCVVSTTERDALMALYNATDGANWTNNTNWGTSAPVCDWYGVTVVNGNVTELDLHNNQLIGTIPSNISDLPNLKAIMFFDNQLNGAIPPEIGNLSNLESLLLYRNQLSELPPELGSLSNLKYFYAHLNQFSGSIPPEYGALESLLHLDLKNNQLSGSIPLEFGDLSNLEILALSANQLSGTISPEFGNLSNLSILQLDNNQLTGDIPAFSSSLTRLWFNTNAFVFSNFENEHNTYTTNLTSYSYSPQAKVDQVETPTILEGNSYTFTTSLSSPNNSYQWYKDDVAIVGATSKDYTINSMALTDAGVYHVLATNSIVTGLTLERNTITLAVTADPCGVSTAERDALMALYNATDGTNWTNNTNWGTSAPVCDWYGVTVTNGSVIRLGLSNNQLVGNIPTELENLSDLEFLHLSTNQLTGSIPVSLGNLIKLKTLWLGENNLSGTIPSELGNLSALENLSFLNNQLTGNIPLSINLISTLNYFYFDTNSFVFSDFENEHISYTNNLITYNYSPQAKVDQVETPTILEGNSYTFTTSLSSPNNSYQWYKDGAAIVGATNKDYTINPVALTDAGVYHVIATNSIVTGLTLERNTITLAVTADTCGVSTAERDALMALYNATDGANWTNTLANNQPWDINVPVCDWYGVTVTNGGVTRLELNGNQLAGNIPIELENLSNLTHLYLNQNQLTGSIPPELGNLSQLKRIYFYTNQLTGTLPSQLGDLSNLTHLHLYNNQLTGNIPTQLGDLSNLRFLYLGSNQLTGTIPTQLGSLSFLTVLELYSNQLSGNIPTELGNLTSLEQLLLQGNDLTGNIPLQFENLTSLKTLRFDSNQLTGNIPSGLKDILSFVDNFKFQNNAFVFNDFETEHNTYASKITAYTYSPQAKVDQVETPTILEGNSYTFTTSLSSPNNSYQWYKDGVAIVGATSKDYIINSVALTDAGVYHVLATNSIVTGLTLERHTITLAVTADTCGVSTAERDALMALYNATDGANWTNTLASNQPWDINVPVCDWYGVTVTNGNVTELVLPNNQLVGAISPELGNLSSLTKLTLSVNQLSGAIPSELGGLINLGNLQLNNNQLSGDIPGELGNLIGLGNLYLNHNQLESIPSSFGNLQALSRLQLNDNLLAGSIPSELGSLANLTHLYLNSNQLTGTIPSTFGGLTSLTTLYLFSNQLSGQIPTSLGNLVNLKYLYLNNNSLTGLIPADLGNLSNLLHLRLYSNQLTGEIPNTFDGLTNLQRLQLNNNQLTGDIPTNINTLANLTILNFHNNGFVFSNFENEHVFYDTNVSTYTYSPQAKVDQVETPTILEGNSYTFTTSLSSPNNSYQWYKDGAAIVGATSKDYTINPVALTDAGVYHVIATNSIITGLTLERHTITLGVTADTCGVSTAERDALMALYNATGGANWTNTLANNQPWDINIPVCDWYGVTVTSGHVTWLDLNGNNLIGTLSSQLKDLPNLEGLFLYDNQIAGTIPSQLGDLSNLKFLQFNTNQLTGSIPFELGNLSSLKHLYLANNLLSGNIPESLGGLTNLLLLGLSGNQLEGVIPPQLGNLSSLQTLNLYVNQLSGSIPTSLGNLPALKYLHLNSNQLSGSIPSSLGNLSNLTNMTLNDNQLTGEIPSSFGNLSLLQYLQLQSNQLEGPLPDTLGNLSSLIYLYLETNQLSGTIPPSISLIPSLNRFRFQENAFIFNDFETEHTTYVGNLSGYQYIPQAKVDQVETPTVTEGTSYTFTTSLSSSNNSYQWYKDGVAIVGATSKDYTINPVALTDAGVYHMLATNSIVTGLTLERHTITLTVNPAAINNNTFCLSELEDYPTVTDLTPSGSNILWYATETGGTAYNNIDEIIEAAENTGGVSYWWDDTTDGMSTRTEAAVTVYSAPEGDKEQAFSIYAPVPTISDIDVVNGGQPVFWYNSNTSTTALSDTELVDGQTYYASSYNGAEAGNSCRLPVTITIGVIPPKGEQIQFLCEGSELSDIVLQLEDGLFAVWYASAEGGSPLDQTTPLLHETTYYIAQLDTNNGEESPKRLAVQVNLMPVKQLVINETTQTFNINASPKVENLKTSGYDVVWYSQATGGNQYGGTIPLDTNGQIYYAEQIQTDTQCPGGNRVGVTVVLVDEPVDPLLGCELFRPELNERYVIDAWLNEREVTTETISEIPFNGSSESVLFVDLLNHLKNRLLSDDDQLHDIPAIYKPVFSSGETPQDLAPLMAYIEDLGASEKELKVYDFTKINDAYGRAIGFSFYLNETKDRQIVYKTPNIIRNGVEETGDLNRYPLLDNDGNTTDEFLKFTKAEVTAGVLKIYADFKQVKEPAHEVSQVSTFSDSNIMKQTATDLEYNEVANQSPISYNQAVIEVSFVDEANTPIGAPVPLVPHGEIIDKWQKVTADFRIPENAGKMIISLKNNDSNKVAYFDDLRILPFESNMKTFVYHPENQRLMSELDENNYATFYEYDLEGGLVRVKKETEEGIYTIQETRSGNIKKAN
ncbi:leucine-rich repeat domain-containing protein [Flavivirga spongiicola]|uniref:Leucine-rich repeat domain-containing protein n=1 Tax=Flavivirga spongiicola TaxID=421621 RepID=A0ABU7XM12_9FLAO|nr:leucine-rich repeat domain-containing protein [Flavivirga sp. MEBiC05379]MDO5981448.1 leucine-rich repeat domain-containing protein [Flavivirga sp. MEBiC05379]